MPIYEYHCEGCDAHFEVLQKVNADVKDLSCPHCGDKRVEKQFSAFATSGVQNQGAASTSSRAGSCGSGGFS